MITAAAFGHLKLPPPDDNDGKQRRLF